ncbi:MAG: AIR synthase-related protein, partial [Acidimicrobiales bacterium]
AIAGMRRINRAASEVLVGLGPGVHATTDVTGFGLFGHAWEVAERSDVVVELDLDAVPAYPGAREAADRGTRTGGDPRNRTYLEGHLAVDAGVGEGAEALGFDPQTSGGLLAAVDPSSVGACEDAGFALVGRVDAGPASVRAV